MDVPPPDRIFPRYGTEDGALLLGVRQRTAKDFRALKLTVDTQGRDEFETLDLPDQGLEYLVALYAPGNNDGHVIKAHRLICVSPYCFDACALTAGHAVHLQEENDVHYATLELNTARMRLLGATKGPHLIRPLPHAWMGWRCENILERPPSYAVSMQERETARLRYAQMMHSTIERCFEGADIARYTDPYAISACPRAKEIPPLDIADNAKETILAGSGMGYWQMRFLKRLSQTRFWQRRLYISNPDGTPTAEPDLIGRQTLRGFCSIASTLSGVGAFCGIIGGAGTALAGFPLIGLGMAASTSAAGILSLDMSGKRQAYLDYLLTKDLPLQSAQQVSEEEYDDDDGWDS